MAMLDGQIALVTGAASGMGRATALVFAREGAKVVLGDRDSDGCDETADLITQMGGDSISTKVDVSNSEHVQSFVDLAISTYGRVDCAFNNAGVEGATAPTADYDESAWDQVISVNLKGVWLCMKAEINAMLRSGGGAIVNTSSIFGAAGSWNMPAYIASKHAVVGVTKAAALDHAQQGIRVNCVQPGSIKTPMLMERFLAEHPDMEEVLIAAHPIGRMGAPDEVSNAVAWLCSKQASFVTGVSLPIDGGYLAI